MLIRFVTVNFLRNIAAESCQKETGRISRSQTIFCLKKRNLFWEFVVEFKINVACGGTLYQDLVKERGFESHSGSRYPRNEGWHRIDFEAQSRFADIFETSSIMVNSYHHQGIRVLGKGCEIRESRKMEFQRQSR